MPRVAAVDCGTNSIRLLIADVTIRDDGTRWLRDVHRETRIVRLGQGVDATGMLAPEALDRTGTALADYVAVLRRKGVERVRMVATSATRDAGNRDEFFGMTRSVLGVEAEVISGEEEARLSFTGAVLDCDPVQGPFLVADIGGGSTELVLGDWDGRTARVRAAKSVDVGCVRITERFLASDPPSSVEIAAAVRAVTEALGAAFDAVPVAEARTWIGVAGTVTTVSAVAQELSEYDPERIHLSRLPLERVKDTTERLLAADHADRVASGVIHPGRVDVIGGGALVLGVLAETLAERASIAELVASEHDILDGIAVGIAD
ncbi:MAG: Ppx/GppA family phosphatase [Kutzneria sp.]|nr:Ppx/GppA family phosphatase [Kutzneria sp.]